MIPFSEIDLRLAALGKTREWLSQVTPYSADYIRTVLAPNSNRRSERVQQILSDAIEKEESLREGRQVIPPGYSEIFLTDAQLNRADRASRLAHYDSLSSFCRDVITAAADEILAQEAADGLRVAEGAQGYKANSNRDRNSA